MSQSATPAMQNDMTTCMETFEKEVFCRFPHRHNDATEKRDTQTRHVDAEKRAFRARLPPIVSFATHYQTGWNVKKCHVCHAKQHDNLLGNIRKGEVFQLPHGHGDATETQAPQDKTRGYRKTSILCETSGNFHSCRLKIKRQVLQLPP